MIQLRKTKPFAGINVASVGPPNCGEDDFIRILSSDCAAGSFTRCDLLLQDGVQGYLAARSA